MADETDTRAALPPLAVALLIGATGWFLLQQLAPLLRPLMLAVFLCYVIVPTYHRVHQRFPGRVSHLIIAGGSVGAIYLLGWIMQSDITELEKRMPTLTERAGSIITKVRAFLHETLPELFPTNPEQQGVLGVDVVKTKEGDGVTVQSVASGLPAEVAKLKIGDIILKADNIALTSPDKLREILAAHKPNDDLTLLLGSSGKEIERRVRLSAEATRLDAERVKNLRDTLTVVLNMAAGVFLEAIVVGIYVLFILLEVGRLPNRMRAAYPEHSGDHIKAVVFKINEAIASYLRVKVKASLLLAVPLGLILWVFGVNLPILWGLLNFFCNFIPYVGSVIGFTSPALFTFLDRGFDWQSIVAVSLVLALHLLLAYVVEPRMTGKAVGLSPLVILISLSFWGLCWGFIGMFLATPLTVSVKLILDNIPATKPIARLLGDE